MPFIELETSEFLGAPIELYHFYSDSFDQPYTYTSTDIDIVYNSFTYNSEPGLYRTQPELSNEVNAQNIEITLPRTNDFVKLYRKFTPPKAVWIRIYRYHSTDGSNPEVVIYWQGRVRGVTWERNVANVSCQLIDTAFNRNGLRAFYTPNCRHMLYDTRTCKVNPLLFSHDATISSITGFKLTSPQFGAFPDTSPVPLGWWVAGFVENQTTGDLRYITQHGGSGNTEITLSHPFELLDPGDVVRVYAGCNRKYDTCINKFNNVVNFGGWPFIPIGNNPFEVGLPIS